VLPEGQIVFLKDTANISTGGTSRDVTHVVHPYNIFLAERIARLMNLDICGIDVIARDINMPLTYDNGAVIEVNAGPGLRMHLVPAKGLGQNVAEPIVNMLFPQPASSRIPIVAVTGTNGKTTTTRLIAHLAKHAGYTTGYTTTDGIYIDDHNLESGDCGGPSSAQKVLRDPIIEFAVLECARGGILRSGLGFDKCSTSVITNITDDHLGLDGIHTMKELKKVKATIAQSTLGSGYAILNADDDLVFQITGELDCNIALFSTDEKNERVQSHCSKGGLAATVEKGYFTIRRDGWGTRVARVNDVPLTLNGKASAMIQNILPAILAAVVNGIDIAVLKKGLQSFIPSPELTPGRMNVFEFKRFGLMIDYAHNSDGFKHLKTFLEQTEAASKVGIITSPGDRRDEDIRNIGLYAAQIFDEIIIRHDKDGRGRSNEEITNLIREGIRKVKPYMQVTVVSDETEAIRFAMETAQDNSFIVACVDEVRQSLDFVIKAKEYEDNFSINKTLIKIA
jgi:cyanophycin synthetase